MPAYSELGGGGSGGGSGNIWGRRWRLAACAVAAAFCVGLACGMLVSLAAARSRSDVVRAAPGTSAPNASGVRDGIYWGGGVEASMPEGYAAPDLDEWAAYVRSGAATAPGAARLEPGCGRMQNRMLVFGDGRRGCVRYRQNTDQIQGELFSFYLAQILGLSNLPPSSVVIVDTNKPLWRNLIDDIAQAKWSSNKPVIITRYIDNLVAATIPTLFKSSKRHLNKFDVFNITSMASQIELAQWSDLIVFDYLTANLDRVVNNLYNYQWNTNIMDAPAHNLAKSSDNSLLLFLDNESGLLHGYRLLKKYEAYHSILLENLCVFRMSTVAAITKLKRERNVGTLLKEMFEQNEDDVKDLLPMLPEKSIKILNERIDKVYGQIEKCLTVFG